METYVNYRRDHESTLASVKSTLQYQLHEVEERLEDRSEAIERVAERLRRREAELESTRKKLEQQEAETRHAQNTLDVERLTHSTSELSAAVFINPSTPTVAICVQL